MPNNPIRYFSTNQAVFGSNDLERRIADGSLETVDLAEAIITGQAPDGGLFIPTHFPQINLETIGQMKDMSYAWVFVETMKGFFDGTLPEATLERIAQEAYEGKDGFKPFLERISDRDIIARLDEGPTLAFKDYAAQVLFRSIEGLMEIAPDREGKFWEELSKVDMFTFIVATSGDTGGAMGHACLDRNNMWMAILHSAFIYQEISDMQAKQMDTLGGNVKVLRFFTEFDGCQQIAQDLLSDPSLAYMNLNSANSISIGRLLPQITYYFDVYSKVADKPGEEIVFTVPSGNFGNAVGGLYAIKMGLPIKIVIGNNRNSPFVELYDNGVYSPDIVTYPSPSNSMNVQWPSNMRRLWQLYQGQLIEGRDEDGNKIVDPSSIMPDMAAMKRDIIGAFRIEDEETRDIIREFYDQGNTIEIGGDRIISTLEPHGAVAWGATQKLRQTGYNGKIITFETAHPGKFPELLEEEGIEIRQPNRLKRLEAMSHGEWIKSSRDYSRVKDTIIELHAEQLAK